MTGRRIYRFDDTEWHVPVSPGTDPDEAAEAGRKGAARKFLAQGDGGFYSQVVRLPPGFEAPEHSHDHAEIFMVLEGSCRFDGESMGRFDMAVVAAINRQTFDPESDFLESSGRVLLADQGRRKLIEVLERRAADQWKHSVVGYSLSYSRMIELETRLLEKEWMGEGNLFARFRLR